MRSLLLPCLFLGMAFASVAPAADNGSQTVVAQLSQKTGAAAQLGGRSKVVNPGGGTADPGGGTTVVYATTSLKCGNTVYQITTGLGQDLSGNGGTCTGKGSSRTCSDGKGNSASVSCSGGCGTTKGGGMCTIMQH